MIIVVANSKGGVGKSTISVHLAVWLAERGNSVTLLDCDAQQSSSEWIQEAYPEIQAVHLTDPDQILDELPRYAREHDFVIADGPGSLKEVSRALWMRADLALFPCKAGMLEVQALLQNTRTLHNIQDIRGGHPKALLILSMVGKRYRLTREIREAARVLEFEVLKTALTLRQVIADAPGQCSVVWRMGKRGSEATKEIKSLFTEIMQTVQQKKKASTRERNPRRKK